MQIFCRYFHSCTVLAKRSSLQILVPDHGSNPGQVPQQAAKSKSLDRQEIPQKKKIKTFWLQDFGPLVLTWLEKEWGHSLLRDLSSRRKKKTSLQETPGLDFALVDSRQRVWLWEGGYIHVLALCSGNHQRHMHNISITPNLLPGWGQICGNWVSKHRQVWVSLVKILLLLNTLLRAALPIVPETEPSVLSVLLACNTCIFTQDEVYLLCLRVALPGHTRG